MRSRASSARRMRRVENLFPLKKNLAAGGVQRSQDQIIGARGLEDRQDFPHARDIDQIRIDVQDRPLGQRGKDLMRGLHAHVRPRFDRRHREVLMELQVRPVRLIHQEKLSVGVADLRDFL